MKFHPHKRTFRGGFTLIEAIVTITIFILLSAVTIMNYRSIDNSLLLDAVANKIAIDLRQAQVSGTSVREDIGGTFKNGFGINFGTSAASTTSYIFFVDRNADKMLTSGEAIRQYSLGKGYSIKKLCVNQKTVSPPSCTSAADPGWMDQLNLTFIRPNPEAILQGIKGGSSSSNYADVEIVIQSVNGSTKTIIMGVTGQISIE